MAARRVVLVLAIVVAAAAGGGYLWWNWVPLHKTAYVAADVRVLAALPPAPGMRERTRAVTPETHNDCDNSMTAACVSLGTKTVGYLLTVTYRRRRGLTDPEVAAWYDRHFIPWRTSHHARAWITVRPFGRWVQLAIHARP